MAGIAVLAAGGWFLVRLWRGNQHETAAKDLVVAIQAEHDIAKMEGVVKAKHDDPSIARKIKDRVATLSEANGGTTNKVVASIKGK